MAASGVANNRRDPVAGGRDRRHSGGTDREGPLIARPRQRVLAVAAKFPPGRPREKAVAPNLDDYDRVRAAFTCDLDAMDFLRFLVALHDRVGVDIPEADYGKLSTLDASVEYLRQRTAAATQR